MSVPQATKLPAAMRGLVDAHSHAHNCVDGSRAVARALATSCSHVLVNATSPSDWAAVKSTCAHFPGRALPQFGVHPWWALDAGAPEGWVPLLAAALRDDAGAGVGEIGLDRSERALERSPLPAQLSALRAQLDLASELRRPVSVHCVRAHALLHEEIKAARARAGALPAAILMHSWSGSPAHASTFKALGVPILFSFAGGLVGAACARLRGDAGRVPGACGRDAVASLLSLASTEIAFETDAPDQSFSHFLSPELKARWGASGDCDSGDWGEGRDVDSGDATDSGAAGGAEGGTPLCCPPPPLPPSAAADSSSPDAAVARNEPAFLHHVVSAAALLRAQPDATPASIAAAAAALGERAATNVREIFFPRV